MPPVFGTSVLVVNILFCLLTVWTSAVDPEGFAARLGLAVVNASGSNEVRAQYAGFFLAVALLSTASLVGLLPRQASFVIMVAVFGGLLAGRVGDLVLNAGIAGYGPTILALYVIEAIGLALAAVSLVLDHAGKA